MMSRKFFTIKHPFKIADEIVRTDTWTREASAVILIPAFGTTSNLSLPNGIRHQLANSAGSFSSTLAHGLCGLRNNSTYLRKEEIARSKRRPREVSRPLKNVPSAAEPPRLREHGLLAGLRRRDTNGYGSAFHHSHHEH